MAGKVVVVGLDCAPPALVFERYRALMPNLSALMRAGSYGPLRSCAPPITVPAWAVMLTGRDPGELGLYGFRNREPNGYGLSTAQSTDVRAPWLWERLAAAGKRVAALFVPPTYPPRAIANGSLVSCLLTPGADLPHTHPPALGAELERECGQYIPDVGDVRNADKTRVLAELYAMTEQHFAIAKHVLREQRPDFMAMVEVGPDRLHHAFWSHLDREDPNDPLCNVGRDYYAFLDAQLGGLLELLDDDSTVLVVSDHGARTLRGGVCVNEWLIEHGYLVLERPPEGPTAPAQLAIDWSRTRAWAEGGYYARVCMNVEGREPRGVIARARFAAERAELLDLLRALPGPDGSRVEHRLLVPEQCYRAQRGNPPDILAFFGDLDYRALGTVGHGRVHLPHDDRGHDTCNHDWDGIFVMSGGGTARLGAVSGYALPDVTRTVLGLMGVGCEPDLLGVDSEPSAMSAMSTVSTGARSLLVGLDGADLSVVHALGRARLPNLFALIDRGAHAALQSVQPPATLPNWTTLLTGVGPGHHGVFDFTTRSGYGVRFTAGSVREAPTIAGRLDRMGKRCACLFFPATYPPERLEHGVFISGWDAPVAFSADASFVWPPALHTQISERFGPSRFDEANQFTADEPGWHARLPDTLCARIEQRVELCEWLLRDRSWDLFAVYFGESDTASHHLWSLWDADSPRHPQGADARTREGLGRVYEALDRALGRLVRAAGGEGVEVTVASDHGSGGSSRTVLYLNRVLAQAGLLRMRPRAQSDNRWSAVLKDHALRRLPPVVRERAFRMASSALPNWLESRVRFGAIDMPRTTVFSDELNYFPALHYNQRGREPHGTLAPADRERARRDVSDALLALRDPYTGARVVRAVHAREELYDGPFVTRAPDLLLELELDDGYSYNLMPSATAPAGDALFRRLEPDEYLGRKGRSLPGSHRPHGLYVAAGPRVRAAGKIEAAIADASATLLARMDVAPPARGQGRCLPVLIDRDAQPRPEPLPHAPMTRDEPMRDQARDDARVAARLRALGYIE